MDHAETRKQRLAQLLDLAQTYKSWTRKDLAKALGRDPTKLVPGTGIPKLDLVVRLAEVLDWPVGDIVAYLWCHETASTDLTVQVGEDFETLDGAAREAHRRGAYSLMVELAQRAREVAKTPEERARACNREAGGWDGLGRYAKVLKAVQRGLQESPVSADFKRMLQSNMANAYYTLWSLVEARAIAADLIAWYSVNSPESLRDRKTRAFSHYVLGHTYRRLIGQESERAVELASSAGPHLERALILYEELANEFGGYGYDGIANTCRGGMIEVEVALGTRAPGSALEDLSDGLDKVTDEMVGDQRESYGWWCIFGCNIALRYLTDERELQKHMALFTNKADEIADQLDNWSIRERVFTMEHSRWERAVGCSGFDIPRVVDEEEVRVIAGTMARFPTFHATGWQILESAKIVRSS